LREELRLRVFGKRVLRRIVRPKRDEVTGEWRKLDNEELNDLYSSASSSLSSSYICHGVGPVVDPFRFHVSRSIFKGLP